VGVRKNQASLTAAEWTAFLNALNTIASTTTPEPRYRDFVRVHVAAMSPVGMSWGVHSMPWMGMSGRNFLAWHRQYLVAFERRLQQVDASVSVPYWDWITHPQIPPRLTGAAFLSRWGITRQWNVALMPDQSDVAAAMGRTTFPSFQQRLENAHGEVHIAVGGTMNSASSPADPVFWLHHANVDRLWAQWQALPIGAAPPNGTERLQPATGYRVRFGMRVNTLLNITTLGYSYA
jgi:tyrosinase